jgi:hypothetical protein
MILVNPLHCKGLALPEQLVIIARLLALSSVALSPFPRFVPFFEILDRAFTPAGFDLLMTALRIAGYLLIFFTPFVRSGCFALATMWLGGLIACQPCHSVGHTYLGCAFLMVSLSNRATGASLLRAQLILLYAGAAINKAVDADWWNGRYFETLMVTRYQNALYQRIAEDFPPMMLSKLFGILTIGTQAALAILFACKRWWPGAILLAVTFHSAMVVLVNQTFGPFFLAIMISCLAFLDWPEKLRMHWRPPRITSEYWEATGFRAIQRALFFSPPVLFAIVLVLSSNYRSGLVRNAALGLLLLLFFPWWPTAPVAETGKPIYQGMKKQRSSSAG